MPKIKPRPETPPPAPKVDRIALSLNDAATASGLGKSTLYAAMKAGTLGFIKVGHRRLVLVKVLEAFLEQQPRGPEQAA